MLAYPTLLQSSYRNAVLNTLGLVSYWRLGEASGTVAKDECGKNDGTYGTGPVLGVTGCLSGDPNTSVRFGVGSTNKMRATQIVWPTQLSMMAWVNMTTWTGNSSLMGQWSGSSGSMFYVLDSSNLRFYINAGNMAATPPSTGAIHLVVGTYDGTQGRIYLDGVLAAGPTNLTGPITSPAVTFDVGGYQGGGGAEFTGVADEAAYFNRPLTAAEIARFYRIGRGF